ncbi:MAG: sigma-70 family RNA polymerase sigma factor [Blastocatellia bacterium]
MKQTFDHLSDEELLRLMLAGDGGAFAVLYQRWGAQVYRFALRLSGMEALAEDVMQEVFLTLLREGQQYTGRGSFAAYLLTITRHSTLRRLQRERRFVALEKDDEEGEDLPVELLTAEADPLRELTRNEQIDAVRAAVLALPLHYREVVLLCHLHELSYAEAAQVIGCEMGTVCSRLYRARALLAERLAALKTQQRAPARPVPQEPSTLRRCVA